jgi:hypothetical protein
MDITLVTLGKLSTSSSSVETKQVLALPENATTRLPQMHFETAGGESKLKGQVA